LVSDKCKRQMIVVLELNQAGKSHVVVNSALLNIIGKIFNERLCFFSEKEHSHLVQQSFNDDANIEYYPYIQIKNFKFFLIKEIVSFFKLLQILFFTGRKKVKLLFITSITPPSLFFLKLLLPLFSCQIIVTLHGELEFLRENKKGFWKYWGKILKGALHFRSNNDLKYLVFGEIVKSNLLQTVELNPNAVLAIDHPFIYDDISNKTVDTGNIKLGIVGVASVHKRSHKIFQIAEGFREEITNSQICFEIVGRVLPNIYSYTNEYVKYSLENDLINREGFENKIANLDYLLFFYDNDYYKLCSSGAFFDAVNFEKPILAIKNDFFCYYFNKLGNIGYLFDSEIELSLKIKDILTNFPAKEYTNQVANLKKAKQYLSLSSISESLYSQLNKWE
jgi:hypothetical protein